MILPYIVYGNFNLVEIRNRLDSYMLRKHITILVFVIRLYTMLIECYSFPIFMGIGLMHYISLHIMILPLIQRKFCA